MSTWVRKSPEGVASSPERFSSAGGGSSIGRAEEFIVLRWKKFRYQLADELRNCIS